MKLLRVIEQNKELRKIFGERELVIIRKQLLGVQLKPSEKTRLSRDIKKKLEAIKILAPFTKEFDLKHATVTKELIQRAKEVILESKYANKIKAIMLFGSTASRKRTLISDIDIAVEFNKIDSKEATQFRIKAVSSLPDILDIQVFNVLPEKIKKSIIKNHKIIYQKNGK